MGKPSGEKIIAFAVPAAFFAFFLLNGWASGFAFPLNDDWSYAMAAERLLKDGVLRLSDWASATQVLHLAGGALSALLFGEGFQSLRLYTALCACGSAWLMFRICAGLGASPAVSALLSAALVFNPLSVLLGNSFMTDMTYLFWMLLSFRLFTLFLEQGREGLLLAAGAAAAGAYLTRQLGIFLPLAFTPLLLARPDKGRKLALLWALPLAAFTGYQVWFNFFHGPTWASVNYVSGSTLAYLSKPGHFLVESLTRLLALLLETGFFLLPAAAGLAVAFPSFFNRNRFPNRLSKAAVVLAVLALGFFAYMEGPLPVLENSLHGGGLGTLTLAGQPEKVSGFFASAWFWKSATLLAAAAAAVLASASALAFRSGEPALKALAWASLLQLAASLAGAKFFDRYLLVFFPWFLASAAYASRHARFSRAAAAVLLLAAAGISWAGIRDYLSWNRAKWEIAAAASAAGYAPAEIANGFDFNAWHSYDENMASLRSLKPLKSIGEWDWQKVNDYRAMVSFAPNPAYRTAATIKYDTPLSREGGTLYLLALDRPAPRSRPGTP
ncbi:MAG: 4-amino-4-deoxy-L-arabinose transferase-related glycosyltransferase of PMT family [Elusimicrobia bacterium]|nr:MAG: 4-amino-4-deoxy-L-arabinose transferase-related glycosyltransferase of PMT family [Elusimicrobiota bacterium]KAF0153834.1 MAG: 4-amino-4-deoxy-L-arabinose transferase-related glycosyltransferase of PMT family [Elusimicrobiota bacterium]